jgi:copper chaperone CopZ
MDFKSTIDLIIKDLNEASEIIDDLKKYPGVPALQVELAKSKCRSAGEVIGLLKSLSFAEPANDQPIHEKQLSHPQDESGESVRQAKVNQLPGEQKPAEIISPSTEKKTVSKDRVKKADGTSIIADKFNHSSNLYDEQLSSIKAEKDISDRLKAKLIASLSEAIGISDKFLFINEIFNGNKESYTQAISRLDKAESLQDAMDIIVSYTGENTESEAVIQLLDLVKLKLPSNE